MHRIRLKLIDLFLLLLKFRLCWVNYLPYLFLSNLKGHCCIFPYANDVPYLALVSVGSLYNASQCTYVLCSHNRFIFSNASFSVLLSLYTPPFPELPVEDARRENLSECLWSSAVGSFSKAVSVAVVYWINWQWFIILNKRRVGAAGHNLLQMTQLKPDSLKLSMKQMYS